MRAETWRRYVRDFMRTKEKLAICLLTVAYIAGAIGYGLLLEAMCGK